MRNLGVYMKNRIRGWLPKEPSFSSPQKTPTFENRLKQHFKIQELPNSAIIIIMVISSYRLV